MSPSRRVLYRKAAPQVWAMCLSATGEQLQAGAAGSCQTAGGMNRGGKIGFWVFIIAVCVFVIEVFR